MDRNRKGLGAALLALVAALALAAAGCGGGGEEAAPPADEGAVTEEEATSPEELTPVKFQLVWTASANALPFIVAKGKGFYEEEGLDLEIFEAQDPTTVLPLVAEGERQIGVSYPPDIMIGASKGLPVVGIWAQYQVNPLGIVSLEDGANIRLPQDLIGKRIGVTTLPMDRAQFAAMLQTNGIEESQVEVVDPGFNGGTLVGEGKLDGASAVPWFETVGLKVAGENPVLMEYRSNGGQIDFPFIVALANQEFAEQNPDAVRAFVRASIRGHEHAVANPDEAIDILMEQYPQLDREVQEIMWQEVIPLAESELTREHDVGYFDMEQLARLADFLSKNGLLDEPVSAEDVFTNKYQPSD